MRDPYEVLGLRRDASADDVKRAYRRLAKQSHPDLNPGNHHVEQRFREITAAYELLSDPAKRARFDRGEIDAAGAERGFGFGFGGHGPGAGRSGGSGSWMNDVFHDDFINELLRGRRGATGAPRSERGADLSTTLRLPFLEAVLGTKRRVNLTVGRTLEVAVPAGIENGQTLRLKGQGHPGRLGGPAGDALVRIEIDSHPFFRRQDQDMHLDLPVTLGEAILGGTVTVPTVHGPVSLKVPRGSNTGTTLRLKGKGVPARGGASAGGDQYVHLQVTLPDGADRELTAFVERWSRDNPYDPRRRAGIV
jgi:DnaJ-class molecular chaperone